MTNHLLMTEDEAYELLAYLVCSAELCTVEPYSYGSFRLLDGASRLMECMLRLSGDSTHAWLAVFKTELDRNKLLLLSDRPAYFRFLEHVGGRVAEGLKRRAARAGSAVAGPEGSSP